MSANVDQKRVLKFGSLQEFNAVSSTLEYPGLFMIGDKSKNDQDGTPINRSASRAAYYALGDAEFGDVLMAQVSTNKMFTITSASYNLEDYPFADYKPIAVCIFDKASNANNQTIFLSTQWADRSNLGVGSASVVTTRFGFYGSNALTLFVNLEQVAPGIRDTGTDHISSIYLNDKLRPLQETDYSGNSVSGSGTMTHSPALCACWRFSTIGTSEGDWYLPSYYDLMKYQENYSAINDVFSNIKTIAGSTYLNDVKHYMNICSEAFSQSRLTYCNNWNLTNSGQFISSNSRDAEVFTRPVFVIAQD